VSSPLNSYSSSSLKSPELSLSQMCDNAYPRKACKAAEALHQNNNIAETGLLIWIKSLTVIGESTKLPAASQRILCRGHGVGIYTSVIDQALGEFPRACIYLLFITEAYYILEPNLSGLTLFLWCQHLLLLLHLHIFFFFFLCENGYLSYGNGAFSWCSAQCSKSIYHRSFDVGMYIFPQDMKQDSSLCVLHVTLCKRNHASLGALFKGIHPVVTDGNVPSEQLYRGVCKGSSFLSFFLMVADSFK